MRLPVLVLILGSCWSSSGAMITLSILPPPISVTTGQSIDFMLQISGHTPGAAPSVGAFDLTVGFDQTLLTPTAVAFGPFLGNTALFEALTSSSLMPSQVNVAEVSLLPSTTLDALQPATFSLATLTCAGIVDDAFGNKLASVPEPGALWLVALPVLALVIGCRRWRLRQIATGYIR